MTLKHTQLSKDRHQKPGLKHSRDFLIVSKHLKIKFKLIMATNYSAYSSRQAPFLASLHVLTPFLPTNLRRETLLLFPYHRRSREFG